MDSAAPLLRGHLKKRDVRTIGVSRAQAIVVFFSINLTQGCGHPVWQFASQNILHGFDFKEEKCKACNQIFREQMELQTPPEALDWSGSLERPRGFVWNSFSHDTEPGGNHIITHHQVELGSQNATLLCLCLEWYQLSAVTLVTSC